MAIWSRSFEVTQNADYSFVLGFATQSASGQIGQAVPFNLTGAVAEFTVSETSDVSSPQLYQVTSLTVPGIINCHRVRIRTSGSQIFIDMHVLLDGGLSFQAAHALTKSVEDVIRKVEPEADVTVHPEPK